MRYLQALFTKFHFWEDSKYDAFGGTFPLNALEINLGE